MLLVLCGQEQRKNVSDQNGIKELKRIIKKSQSAQDDLVVVVSKTRPSGQRCVLMYSWAYPLIERREMRGGNLSTEIAIFGGRYARELF